MISIYGWGSVIKAVEAGAEPCETGGTEDTGSKEYTAENRNQGKYRPEAREYPDRDRDRVS